MRGAIGLAALGALGWGAFDILRRQEEAAYAEALADGRAPAAPDEPPERALLRYATMAANSHNTQPWRFAVAPDRIRLLPDLARRTPAVDPDDHHLHSSLGCALENMVQAASALGLRAEPEVAEDSVAVRLERVPASPGALFAAIPRRQSTRAAFDGSQVDQSELRALAAAGEDAGVELLLITDPSRLETLLDFVVAGNAAQMRDAAFMAELLAWIRFSHAEALTTRDGLFGATSGNPALPRAIGERLFPHVFTIGAETDKYVRHLRSSAGAAVFVAEHNSPAGWVAAGRCAQRFCLQATALGLRTAWVNQPVEVPGLRDAFASWLGVAPHRPDLVLRFGRGPELPFSLRRPIAEVVAEV